MFGIHFADPTRETVGQRRLRKGSKGNELSRASSLRSSRSSDSAQRDVKQSLLNLFGGGHDDRNALAQPGSHSKLSVLRAGEAGKSSRRVSSYTVVSDSPIRNFTGPGKRRNSGTDNVTSTAIEPDADCSGRSEAAESIFSGWTRRSSTTDTSWGSTLNSPTSKSVFNQAQGSTSPISRSTELSISPRNSISLAERVANVVQISAVSTIPVQVESSNTNSKRDSTTFDFPVPHFLLPEKPLFATKIAPNGCQSVPPKGHPTPLPVAGPSSGLQSIRQSDTTDVILSRLQQPLLSSFAEKKCKPSRPALTRLQKDIRRMEAASSKIILERLKEEWIEVVDASIYRELELEKQRWMLFALRDLKTTRLSGCEDSRRIQVSPTGTTKVLSLYENHASASFLSALSGPFTQVHHLCSTPISQKAYPNIRPFAIQKYETQLPYEDNSFTSIHAFSLPVLFPASSLPSILKECHRLLSPDNPSRHPALQSTLHLTIIDPLPLSSTLGPLLREWLDDHLMFNLEQQFRCLKPSRLFPIWLQDAGLRAEGSMILTVPFLASVNAQDAEALLSATEHEIQCTPGVIDKTGIVKQELKSVAGRMLWKEMWGPFVQGRRWWWQEKDIIEECEQMRTCWEYSAIDAVREDS